MGTTGPAKLDGLAWAALAAPTDVRATGRDLPEGTCGFASAFAGAGPGVHHGPIVVDGSAMAAAEARH